MAWTYDITTPVGQVRFLIGDTLSTDPLIEDDNEISFCLTQKNNDIYLAGASACRRAAAKLLRELSLTGPEVAELDSNKQYTSFMETARTLEMESVKQGGAGVFFGGISQSDKDAREQNTDRVVPSFDVDLHQPQIPNSEPESMFWFGW